VYDRAGHEIKRVARLEDPARYRVWYVPRWYLELDTLETLPEYVVEYDPAGREIARWTLPPRPQVTGAFRPSLPVAEPSSVHVGFGLVTPPAEAVVLTGTPRYLLADFRASGGREMWLLLRFLSFTTSYFIPGAGWNMRPDAGLVFGYAALMLLSAMASALACWMLARSYAFSRTRCLGWALCGLMFGVVGLLLMLSLQEWPARVRCRSCGRGCVVDRERCEHCGAPPAPPPPDGTEIWEETASEQLARCPG
jgi:hypothetical protein